MILLDKLQSLGHKSLSSVQRLGRGHVFLLKVLPAMEGMLFRPSLLIRQMYSVGVQTLLIIVVAGLFVGMVIALQAYNALVDFGAEDSVSVMVVLSLLRELGPVVTALLFAGRAGSARMPARARVPRSKTGASN